MGFFEDGLYPQMLTKEYIRAAVADCDDVTVEYADDKEIQVWDDQDCKIIRFRFLEGMGPEDLAGMISISKDIPQEYQVNNRVLAEYLWEACDRNAFVTLEELVVIWSEPDDPESFEPADFEDSEARRLCDELGDEYALEIGQGLLGQLWFERNIAVVNLGEVVRAAEQVAKENEDCWDPWFSLENQIEMGFLTTVLHELRHLQMDTNIILPEEEYPVELAAEENVEEYCREAFESAGIPKNLFLNLYIKRLEETLKDAASKADDAKAVQRQNKTVEKEIDL